MCTRARKLFIFVSPWSCCPSGRCLRVVCMQCVRESSRRRRNRCGWVRWRRCKVQTAYFETVTARHRGCNRTALDSPYAWTNGQRCTQRLLLAISRRLASARARDKFCTCRHGRPIVSESNLTSHSAHASHVNTHTRTPHAGFCFARAHDALEIAFSECSTCRIWMHAIFTKRGNYKQSNR